MNKTETNRFNKFYQRHLRLLKLQGKAQKTIDAYSRAVRRISESFDCCPDQLTVEQLEKYFSRLVESHSWSTGNTRYRTLKGEDFLWLVFQHVLPKGFRRVRDYGFLHGNAKKLLTLVQMILQVLIEACVPRSRPV